MKTKPSYNDQVFRIVRRIPHGRVMTYGQIAELLGEGYTPRTVGFAMHNAGTATPWHRVINAQGRCSSGRVVLPHDKQQRLLETEGVRFDKSGRCELSTYLWIPGRRSADRPPKTTLFKKHSRKRKEGR